MPNISDLSLETCNTILDVIHDSSLQRTLLNNPSHPNAFMLDFVFDGYLRQQLVSHHKQLSSFQAKLNQFNSELHGGEFPSVTTKTS